VVSQECLELVNGLKNVVAFGFVYATVPWTGAQGFAKVCTTFPATLPF